MARRGWACSSRSSGHARGRAMLDEETRKAHEEAEREGEACYRDPATGLWVLTEGYLRRRGWCCRNGCRHCPYPEGTERGA